MIHSICLTGKSPGALLLYCHVMDPSVVPDAVGSGCRTLEVLSVMFATAASELNKWSFTVLLE